MFESTYLIFQAVAAILALIFVLKLSQARASFAFESKFGIANLYFEKFSRAGFTYPKESVRNIVVGSLSISFLFGLVFSLLLAFVLPLLSAFSIWFYLNRKIQTSFLKQQNVNDEICYFLARALRAGYTLEQAISRAGEQFPESIIINQLVNQTRSGFSIAKSTEKLIQHEKTIISTPEKMVCATIALANEMGGNSARIFDRIGDNFHMCYELLDDTNSQLAQVRLSAYLICGLPLAMFGISFLTGSESIKFMFTNPIGILCLVLGISLELTGICWMKSMVKRGVGVWSS